jgi:hypothetical protein
MSGSVGGRGMSSQEVSPSRPNAYNGHFESACYHPLLLFNRNGDCYGHRVSTQFFQHHQLEAASGFKHHTLRRGTPHNLMSRAIPRASLLTLDVSPPGLKARSRQALDTSIPMNAPCSISDSFCQPCLA